MKLWKILAFVLAFILCERFCHYQTHGFRIHKILSNLSFNPDWEVAPLSEKEMEKIEEALNQPYIFLGSGAQCYAFSSQDNQYVLKVFKHHHARQNFWKNQIPIPGFLKPLHQHLIVHNHKPLEKIFRSCKLAFELIKEETGLVYLHLNKTHSFNKTLTLVDPIGIAHSVDRDKLEFILQYKGTMAYPTVLSLIKKNDQNGAKQHLEALLDVIVARCKAGIADRDPIIKRNFAFIGQKAIIIDTGCFSYDPYLKTPFLQNRLLFLETMKCRRWVSKKAPELLPFFEEKILEKITLTSLDH